MIEPTDEMVEAAGKAIYGERPLNPAARRELRAGLANAFAIVERDYDVRNALCVQSNPDDWGALCELWRGHPGQHRARVSKAVQW